MTFASAIIALMKCLHMKPNIINPNLNPNRRIKLIKPKFLSQLSLTLTPWRKNKQTAVTVAVKCCIAIHA